MQTTLLNRKRNMQTTVFHTIKQKV